MSLKFSAWHLVIGEEMPSAEGLNPAFAESDDTYYNNGTYYLISKENLDDKYFWLSARYGTSLPYSDTVYNTTNQVEEDNPRSTNQIEPRKQLFALYCVHSHTLYLSSATKKSWVEEYLKAKLEKDVVIKAFYNNVDEFAQIIKSVEKVKLVAKSNLFNSKSGILDIFPNPKDIFGLGMPEDFTLEANFSNVGLTPTFIESLKRMAGWKNDCKAESLLCIGRDDKNFEMVFNADNFIQKVSVAAYKDDQGLYEPDIVKQALISKIGDFDEENS